MVRERIILVKLVLGDVLDSTYVPQLGLPENIKREFGSVWMDYGWTNSRLPKRRKIIYRKGPKWACW